MKITLDIPANKMPVFLEHLSNATYVKIAEEDPEINIPATHQQFVQYRKDSTGETEFMTLKEAQKKIKRLKSFD
jgi:hypothetical protein